MPNNQHLSSWQGEQVDDKLCEGSGATSASCTAFSYSSSFLPSRVTCDSARVLNTLSSISTVLLLGLDFLLSCSVAVSV